jgi:hypothetical protein
VFWQGPAIGGELSYRFAERWTVDLGYRHSFLVDVSVSNTFTEGLGFSDFSTDGQRDVVELHLGRELAPRWMARLGYRFESARVDASRTQARMSSGPNPAFLQAQFPRNDHTVNALSVGVTFTF